MLIRSFPSPTEIEAVRPARRRSLSRRVKAFMEPRLIGARRHLPPARVLPDFIIIGARKCGTSFLYRNLVRQRGFLAAYKKEVEFFDKHYARGAAWYRAHFPTGPAMRVAGWIAGKRALTGESTPLYLVHPKAPERIRALLPEARLIVLLRNPVDRAYSAYEHQVRRGYAPPTFEAALEAELDFHRKEGAGERRKLETIEDYLSPSLVMYSYLSGGIYVDQLEPWYARFPAEQLLIVKAEEMYQDAQAVLARVTEFLGGRPQTVRIVRENRKHGYPKMNPETRARLEAYFAPHNARLYRFLEAQGCAFAPWES